MNRITGSGGPEVPSNLDSGLEPSDSGGVDARGHDLEQEQDRFSGLLRHQDKSKGNGESSEKDGDDAQDHALKKRQDSLSALFRRPDRPKNTIESKDVESKGSESQDVESKDVESKGTESQDVESKDIESEQEQDRLSALFRRPNTQKHTAEKQPSKQNADLPSQDSQPSAFMEALAAQLNTTDESTPSQPLGKSGNTSATQGHPKTLEQPPSQNPITPSPDSVPSTFMEALAAQLKTTSRATKRSTAESKAAISPKTAKTSSADSSARSQPADSMLSETESLNRQVDARQPDTHPAEAKSDAQEKPDTDQDQASSKQTQQTATSGESIPQVSGDQILQGLVSQSPVEPTADNTAPTVSDRISEIADRLADRILVSDRSQTGESEVRIRLRGATLQGTEISIRHDQGQLVVNFNVPNADVRNTVLPQTDNLQQHLMTRLNEDVRVEVSTDTGSGSGQQQGSGSGQQQDRGSRNRREYSDEWDADN